MYPNTCKTSKRKKLIISFLYEIKTKQHRANGSDQIFNHCAKPIKTE